MPRSSTPLGYRCYAEKVYPALNQCQRTALSWPGGRQWGRKEGRGMSIFSIMPHTVCVFSLIARLVVVCLLVQSSVQRPTSGWQSWPLKENICLFHFKKHFMKKYTWDKSTFLIIINKSVFCWNRRTSNSWRRWPRSVLHNNTLINKNFLL